MKPFKIIFPFFLVSLINLLLLLNMPTCIVIGCSNRPETGSVVVKFPKDPVLRAEWARRALGRKWQPTDRQVICEDHFDKNCWLINEQGRRSLRHDALPTSFPHDSYDKKSLTPKISPGPSPTKIARCRVKLYHSYAQSPSSAPLSSPKQTSDEDTESNLSCTPLTCFTPPNRIPIHRNLANTSGSPRVPTIEMTPTILLPSKSFSPGYRRLARTATPEKIKKHFEFYKSRYYKQRLTINRLRSKLQKEQIKVKILQGQKEETILQKVFNPDQIQVLKRKSKRAREWSKETVKKAFKLRFACGTTGYDELRRQGQPWPTIRTLNRRIEHLKFDTGVQHEIIDRLAPKVEVMTECQRDAVMAVDEMSVSDKVEFDIATGSFTGHVTLPGHTGPATHVVVFMVGGISSRWKQTVAYHFTGDSTDGIVFKDIILDLISRLEKIKVRIHAITSDMGSVNQGFWASFGICCTRTLTRNSIPHPCDANRKLWFLADVPHLLKNHLKMLVNHKQISFSQEIANKHNLPSRTAETAHIQALIDHDVDKQLKLNHKLKANYLQPGHFDSMKVGIAYNVLNHKTAKSLEFLVQDEPQKYSRDLLTTAWYINQIFRWFKLMTSRHPVLALSLKNKEIYEESIKFLKDLIELFKTLDFGVQHDTTWKPTMTGVILSTTSILELSEMFLREKGYAFLLTSRFTQDCVENLFSVLRSKLVILTALQVKRHLKLITVSQYIKPVSNSSYDQDDREFLGDFFEKKEKENLKKKETEDEELSILSGLVKKNNAQTLDSSELNSLYHLAGYIVHQIKSYRKVCKQCVFPLMCKEKERKEIKSYDALQRLKEYKEGKLVAVTQKCFEMFKELENGFRASQMVFPEVKNLKDFVYSLLSDRVSAFKFRDCHDIKSKLITRFVTCRLRMYAQHSTKVDKKIDYSSKSVCMRALAKNVGKETETGRKKKNVRRKKNIGKRKQNASNNKNLGSKAQTASTETNDKTQKKDVSEKNVLKRKNLSSGQQDTPLTANNAEKKKTRKKQDLPARRIVVVKRKSNDEQVQEVAAKRKK